MSFDFVPGEEVILQAVLRKDRWMKYRCVTCSMRCLAANYFAPIFVPMYACFGGSCRREEADSFELVLTNKNLYCRQMLYNCGLCCQTSGTIAIPLEKIQDIQLISNWVGDSCGIVDKKGDVYQLYVQTAAMGGMAPELMVFCIENIREFKMKVIEARNALKAEKYQGGQSKSQEQPSYQAPNLQQALATANQEQLARILALLERQSDDPVATAPSTVPHKTERD